MENSEKSLLGTCIRTIQEELIQFESALTRVLQVEHTSLQPFFSPILKDRGKRIRPILFFLVQGLFAKPVEESIHIAVLIELLHTATLIHDDVIDCSLERRGSSSLNALWGDRISVLMGDYLLAKVLQIGVDSPYPKVLDVIAPVVLSMVSAELLHEGNQSSGGMSKDDYFRIIKAKTAGLFGAAAELATRVMGASAEQTRELNRFGELYGIAFQIQDDVLDISGSSEQMGKPQGQDVLNGKWTLPLLLAKQSAPETERDDLLKKMGRGNKEDSIWIQEFIIRFGGIEKAMDECGTIIEEALHLLDSFGPSTYRESLTSLLMHALERQG